jgi:D-beta-D-heptose 7-phosphate kinase/D-beta-D-heptose 1-phosphate adenosyltransferase
VKGEDWSGKKVAGAGFVESTGGRVVFAPLVQGKSTSNMIEKAKSENTSPERQRRVSKRKKAKSAK